VNRRTLVVDPESAGQRLDRFLVTNLPDRSRSYLQKLIDDSSVLVGGRSERAAYRVRAGQRIEVIEPPPRPAEPQPQAIPLNLVYEDAHLVVVDKPAGLVVHPAPGSPDGTLVNALLEHCRDLSGIGGVERPGIVHRLDRNTSGLLVVTKNDRAHQHLSAQFQQRRVAKTYRAWAARRTDVPELAATGTFDTGYGRHPVHRKRFSSRVSGGKRAVTHYRVLARHRGGAWEALELELRLETGRTHQIRVHLADAGHPLLGDKLYGGRRLRGFPLDLLPERQALHAWRLGFDHPVSGERLDFEAPLPADLKRLAEQLRLAARRS
jgi:23S rRNA pseudouridine1911/1915/1917 synthase